MVDVDDARRRWLQERPKYVEFAGALRCRLDDLRQSMRLPYAASARAKDVDSLVRKLLKRSDKSYDTLADKVGARVVVLFQQDVESFVTAVQQKFECGTVEHTGDRLGVDGTGYSGDHLQVKFALECSEAREYPPDAFEAELQVRTLGQHLWAEMSHDTIYKAIDAPGEHQAKERRRMHMLAGLIEVAEGEFNRIRDELSAADDVHLLNTLERHFLAFSARRGDRTLSLDVIRLLQPLYGVGFQEIERRMEAFVAEHRQGLNHLYDDPDAPERLRSVFFSQPEILMIFERLRHDQYQLMRAWQDRFPERELESLALALGFSFH